MQPTQAILIDERDHVATAFVPLAAGSSLRVQAGDACHDVVLREPIAPGHKFAVVDISSGAQVMKYAASIGRASQAIRAGDHVHLHNLESLRGRGDKS